MDRESRPRAARTTLLIDDNGVLIAALLAPGGYQTVLAGTGREGPASGQIRSILEQDE